MKTPAEFAVIFAKNNVPLPNGDVLDAAYKAKWGDWYAKTEAGWWWYDSRENEGWKAAPRGPE